MLYHFYHWVIYLKSQRLSSIKLRFESRQKNLQSLSLPYYSSSISQKNLCMHIYTHTHIVLELYIHNLTVTWKNIKENILKVFLKGAHII